MRAKRQAFTLVELVIVMLVLGILAGVAAPRFVETLRWNRLQASGRRMVADLKLAQAEAMRLSSPRRVEFDAATNTYTLVGVTDPNHRDVGNYAVRVDQTSYPVDLVSADFSAATQVTFDIYGRPSSGGSVVFETQGQQNSVVVSINGAISLQ